MQKKIVIFGSTGSIGQNCLEVISSHPERFKVLGLAAKSNWKLLSEQVERFRPQMVAIADPKYYSDLKRTLPEGISIYAGEEEITRILEANEKIDLAVNAIVGAIGLIPTLSTLEKGINLALANKESLVTGGEIVLKKAKEHNVTLLPIDSEHSAIFQCLLGEERSSIDTLILTASGGPCLDTPIAEFTAVTPEIALKHPNWNMGTRITIDSATMVNKGLEVMEAHWLFNIPPEKIEVVIHRQSIVHSLVRLKDGTYLAQMGAPDMRLPIQFALTYPERLPSPYGRLDFTNIFKLDFRPVSEQKFPCLKLAYRALALGGLAPTLFNAADECAVVAFLQRKINFDQIPAIIARVLDGYKPINAVTIEEIFKADKNTREFVKEII
jgi:1-deoxy-D-xylulose-5-phosphate reductoisomerase